MKVRINMDKKKYDYVIYKIINGQSLFLADPLFCELGDKLPKYIPLTATALLWSTKYLVQAQTQAALLCALGEGKIEIMQIEYQYTLKDVAAWCAAVKKQSNLEN